MAERGFVISDLHLGGGAAEPELEDFKQDEQLVSFVDAISDPDTTLFINGDFVDFAQIPPYETPSQRDFLWTEADSLAKLELALTAHHASFEALARFVGKGGQLRILIGNHDLDFVWPEVQKRMRQVVGERLGFTVGEELYHGVVIEHGYTFTPENCPRDPKKFVLTTEDGKTDYLERVWGTDFMLHFYNDLERRYPFADNVKPMLSVMFHGLKNQWIGAKDVVSLVVFLKRRGVSWKGIASSLLGDEQVTLPTLVASLESEEWQSALVARAQSDPAFEAELAQAVRALPPQDRAALADPSAPARTELPNPDLGAQGGTQVMGIFRDGRERRAAKEWLAMGTVTHVVYGHTHVLVDGDLDGRLYNPGTWLPHLDLAQSGVREKIQRYGLTLEMLRDESLYTAERWAVRIVPEKGLSSRVSLERV
jgi:UDP-2,3-diacylglucosamine pyrophosphatase LpxH